MFLAADANLSINAQSHDNCFVAKLIFGREAAKAVQECFSSCHDFVKKLEMEGLPAHDRRKICQVIGKYLTKVVNASRKNYFAIAACVKARIVPLLKLENAHVIGAKIKALKSVITMRCVTMRC
jgi:hypothetical protein